MSHFFFVFVFFFSKMPSAQIFYELTYKHWRPIWFGPLLWRPIWVGPLLRLVANLWGLREVLFWLATYLSLLHFALKLVRAQPAPSLRSAAA